MSKKKSKKQNGPNSLVGTWIEEENDFHTSTVVYTIAVNDDGVLAVNGIDESDGVELRISRIRWDGERLHFITVFPATKHRASHIFWLVGRKRAAHVVSYSDEDGHHTVNEVWKRRARHVGSKGL